MTSQKMIKLSKMVQPHFYSFWRSKAPYLILNGGRGSFKSSTVSLKLLMMLKRQTQQGHKANVIIIRENTVNLRDSVYSQISWAIGHAQNDRRVCVQRIAYAHNTSWNW